MTQPTPSNEAHPPAATGDDDASLVNRLASGDHSAVGVLYDRHAPQVFAIGYRILKSASDAEDVVQDVFVQAWRTARRYDRARGTVAGWLLVMARTRAIDRLRAARVTPDPNSGTWLQSMQAPAVPVTTELIATDQASRIRAAMVGLPLEQRQTLELAYFEGLTQSEIASRLSQPLGTIKTRIRLALAALRRSVGR